MNKSYKVVFSKVRGALMVVNEATASVQAKGAKTVIAAAVTALVAGGAIAAETTSLIPDVPDGAVEEAPKNGEFVDQNYKFSSDAQDPVAFYGPSASGTFDKNLWIVADAATDNLSGFWATGKDTVFTNAGNIYVDGSAKDVKSYQQHALSAADGAKVVNKGLIAAVNGYGMTTGTTGAAGTIVNDGRIVIDREGAGMELGGMAGAKGENNGTITVTKGEGGAFAVGALIKSTSGNTFTNNGTIVASGEGEKVRAISVEQDSSKTNNNTVILGAGSKITGNIYVQDGTQTTLKLDGMQDTLSFEMKSAVDKLEVVNGAQATIADAVKDKTGGTTFKEVDISNGTLTASIFQENNKFKKVTVGEDGVFNITALNSKKADTDTENNRLLLAFGADYTLNGGKLQVAGADFTGDLKVGSASADKGTGKLTITAGNYSFNSLEIGNQTGNSVTLSGGSLTLGDLSFAGTENNGSFSLSGGRLVMDGEDVFTKGTEEGAKWALTDALTKVTKTDGVLEITDTNFEYSLANLKYLQGLLNSEDSSVQLILNGTLTDKSVSADDVDGLNLADQTATIAESSATFNKDTTLGALEFGEADQSKAVTVTVAENHKLTLEGNGGDLFKLAEGTEKVSVSSLELGTSAESTGTVNVATLAAQNLIVTGAYGAQTVEVSEAADVNGTLSADVLQGSGEFTVGSTGTLVIGEAKTAAAEASLLADAPAAPVLDAQIKAVVKAEAAGAVMTTHADGEALLKAAAAQYGVEYDETKNVGLYVDHTIAVDSEAGKLLVGTMSGEKEFGTVALGANSITVIDVKAFDENTAVFDAAHFAGNQDAQIILAGADSVGSILFAQNMQDEIGGSPKIIDNNGWLNYAFGTLTDGKVMLNATFDQTATDDAAINAFAESVLTNNTASKAVVTAIGTHYLDENGKITDAGVDALDDYMALPLISGTYNAAYDAAEQVWNTVSRHNTDRQSDKAMGVWADVFYASNAADNMYADGYGYESDVYGGVLGFDYTASCGGRLGAAFTIGTSDAESNASQYKNDADFWGLSVYASKNAGEQLLFSADVSYVALDNDVKGSIAGASADESLDSSVLSVGVRADWKAYESTAFSVVPHVGVRYAAIDVDDYREFSSDSMNVVEAPIGVTVKGAFDMSGVKVAPMFDFTAVPQLGDKDVETYLGDKVDVLKETYNTTLGVEAVMGDFSLGLKGVYGFGTNDRENVGVNLNAVYRF